LSKQRSRRGRGSAEPEHQQHRTEDAPEDEDDEKAWNVVSSDRRLRRSEPKQGPGGVHARKAETRAEVEQLGQHLRIDAGEE
jgi:hypothetical protein